MHIKGKICKHPKINMELLICFILLCISGIMQSTKVAVRDDEESSMLIVSTGSYKIIYDELEANKKNVFSVLLRLYDKKFQPIPTDIQSELLYKIAGSIDFKTVVAALGNARIHPE